MADDRKTKLCKDLLGFESRAPEGGLEEAEVEVICWQTPRKEKKSKKQLRGYFWEEKASREARARRKDKVSGGNALQILAE